MEVRREIRGMKKQTRDIVAASYTIPDLETAVQEAVYNAIDANARLIKITIDFRDASFSVIDDGDGICPDDLYKYIGECLASSRIRGAQAEEVAQPNGQLYGKRGEFLYMLCSLTTVEIESRIKEHWASHRKVFQDGAVVFNARTKVTRPTSGTTLVVDNLFRMLPVRKTDLARNSKYRARCAKRIQTFCTNMSMIWPTLTFEINCKCETTRSLRISGVSSCYDRFVQIFGNTIGTQLQYVDFTPNGLPFSIRGYVAVVCDGWEVSLAGLKQAKAYYQYVFLNNQWIENCHRICAKVITDAAAQLFSGIPILVLKLSCSPKEYDFQVTENGRSVLFRSLDLLHEALYAFVKSIASTESVRSLIAEHDLRPSLQAAELKEIAHLQVPSGDEDYAHAHDRHDRSGFFHVTGDEQAQWVEIDQYPQYSNDMEKELELDPLKHFTPWTTESSNYMLQIDGLESVKCVDEVTEGYDVSSFLNVPEKVGWDGVCVSCHCKIARDTDGINGTYERLVDWDDGDSCLGSSSHGSEVLGDVHLSEYPNTCNTIVTHSSKGYEMPAGGLEKVFFAESTIPNIRSVTCEEIEDSDSCVALQSSWLSSESTYWRTSLYESETSDGYTADDEVDAKAASNYGHVNFSATSTTDHNRSEYFASPMAFQGIKRFPSSTAFRKNMTATLRVDSGSGNKKLRPIKLNKSLLKKLQVIRQVDRKFILVAVNGDNESENLLICIDQHAADERVRLEKLEEQIFGPDGSERNIDVHVHDSPLALQVNHKESHTLTFHEKFVRSWGFDFKRLVARSSVGNFNDLNAIEGNEIVLLRTTPKVEQRIADADDFREFIQLLSESGGYAPSSQLRPPVITRLLHSRACRSAIMFGDHLSVSQCRDLIDDLQHCQLPFQCAHGRPSVVPLAEFTTQHGEISREVQDETDFETEHGQ